MELQEFGFIWYAGCSTVGHFAPMQYYIWFGIFLGYVFHILFGYGVLKPLPHYRMSGRYWAVSGGLPHEGLMR